MAPPCLRLLSVPNFLLEQSGLKSRGHKEMIVKVKKDAVSSVSVLAD